MYRLLAKLVALSHLGFVVLVVIGGPLASRYPRIIRYHLAALAAALAINLTGSDCPLTVIEKDLIRASGDEPYETGFNSHYLVEPVYSKGITGRVNLIIMCILVGPTVLGYSRAIRRIQRQAS